MKLCILFIIFLSIAYAQEIQKNGAIGKIVKFSGPGFIQRFGQTEEIRFALGYHLFQKDKLYTKNSKAHLLLLNGTKIELGINSELTIKEYSLPENIDAPIRSQLGKFHIIFEKGFAHIVTSNNTISDIFTIRTSNGFLRIYSPADFFIVQQDKSSEIEIHHVHGKLEILGAVTNDTVYIEDNSTVYIKKSGLLSKQIPFSEENKKLLLQQVEL